jgi:hypothetical protein
MGDRLFWFILSSNHIATLEELYGRELTDVAEKFHSECNGH